MSPSSPSQLVAAPVESNWAQDLNPEINKVEGEHTNNADSYVILENVKNHTSVLTITLIIIAVLFIIHFLVQFYQLHVRSVRLSERRKISANLPQPVVPTPTSR